MLGWNFMKDGKLPLKLLSNSNNPINRSDWHMVQLSNKKIIPAEYIFSRNGWFSPFDNKPLKNVIAWFEIEPL
jgi:hypothetical protein